MARFVIEGTQVIDHEKFLEAGVHGRDLWEWGMKYSGKHETDGALSMSAVLASPWGYGGKANIKAATRLVEVGLWERTEKGFQILRWSEQGNKTKTELAESREFDRKKKAQQRAEWAARKAAKFCDVPVDVPKGVPGGRAEGLRPESVPVPVPVSLGSGSREGMQGEAEPPEWFMAAIATAEGTGEKIRPKDAWLRYSGHRAGKGIPKTQQDAVYWLTTVMVPEARKERRQEADKRDRDAKFDRQRSGPEPRAPPSQAQAKAMAEELRKRLAARKGHAA